MPLKLRKNNSLELGSIYSYEGKNYLVIRSDYEKSKAYEINSLDEVSLLELTQIKNFYNEDAQHLAKPKIVKKMGKNFEIGEFIMQDGLIYVLEDKNNTELVFTDFPKTNCPIYFFSPLESHLYQLKSFIPIKKNESTLSENAENQDIDSNLDEDHSIVEEVELDTTFIEK
jgi:hypothetical protein